ncbi:uncharacterized protein LOC110242910 [Exaiptasia diaphana]|uniref:ShKT domain-containing protein n=1 Tax=Exaiptasia diaphana TaxID=2652724 RepID=A0A913YLX7_EXADI|nr:uncharacterized protein LOC110242910 [Exaiptasia diaphana]
MRKCWILFISVINYTSFTSQGYVSGYFTGCRDAISNCRQRFNSMNHHPYFCFRYGQSCKRFCQMCHSDCRDTWGYGYYCHGWRRRGQCRTSYAAKKCRKTCSFCRK